MLSVISLIIIGCKIRMDDPAIENNINHILCDICNLSFNKLHDLTLHKIVHKFSKSQDTSEKKQNPIIRKKKLRRHQCETCDTSYSDISDYKLHMKIDHGVVLDSKEKPTKHKKKFTRHYCKTCLKYYSQTSAFKSHMKVYHGVSDTNQHGSTNDVQIVKTKSIFSRKKSTKDSIGYCDNIFTEFENQMPLEMRDDQYRCNMCDVISANSTEYMEHEKKHYQTPLVNNPGDSYMVTTVDDYSSSNTCSNDDDISSNTPTQNDDITCDTASNNENIALNTINYYNNTLNTSADNINTSDTFNNNQISDINNDKSTKLLNNNINLDNGNDDVDDQVSVTIDVDDDDDYDDVDDDDNSSMSSDSYANGNDLGILHYDSSNSDCSDTLNRQVIICNLCQGVFTSSSDFEQHQQPINENLKICINQTDLLSYGTNEHASKTENKRKIKILQKHSGIDHLKALDEIFSVPQQFYCTICKETCEQMEHFQYNQWWNPCDQVMKCCVCCKQFFDKEELQSHKMEHVNINFC